MSAELYKWRATANARITPIENIKTEILSTRESLDQRFPTWKEAYDANPQDFMSHDARREYFVSLRLILQNVQLVYVYIRDHLTDENWWRNLRGEFQESAVLQSLRELTLMVVWSSFHSIAMMTEETCRAIVRADTKIFGVNPGGSIYNIYQCLFKHPRIRDLPKCCFVLIRSVLLSLGGHILVTLFNRIPKQFY